MLMMCYLAKDAVNAPRHLLPHAKPRLECRFDCGKSFTQGGSRNRHEKRCHSNHPSYLGCPFCKKHFGSRIKYDHHCSSTNHLYNIAKFGQNRYEQLTHVSLNTACDKINNLRRTPIVHNTGLANAAADAYAHVTVPHVGKAADAAAAGIRPTVTTHQGDANLGIDQCPNTSQLRLAILHNISKLLNHVDDILTGPEQSYPSPSSDHGLAPPSIPKARSPPEAPAADAVPCVSRNTTEHQSTIAISIPSRSDNSIVDTPRVEFELIDTIYPKVNGKNNVDHYWSFVYTCRLKYPVPDNHVLSNKALVLKRPNPLRNLK
jgi:hypothetical protein